MVKDAGEEDPVLLANADQPKRAQEYPQPPSYMPVTLPAWHSKHSNREYQRISILPGPVRMMHYDAHRGYPDLARPDSYLFDSDCIVETLLDSLICYFHDVGHHAERDHKKCALEEYTRVENDDPMSIDPRHRAQSGLEEL